MNCFDFTTIEEKGIKIEEKKIDSKLWIEALDLFGTDERERGTNEQDLLLSFASFNGRPPRFGGPGQKGTHAR